MFCPSQVELRKPPSVRSPMPFCLPLELLSLTRRPRPPHGHIAFTHIWASGTSGTSRRPHLLCLFGVLLRPHQPRVLSPGGLSAQCRDEGRRSV